MINDIEPIIVINKCDIVSKEFIEKISNEYKFLEIYEVSAKESIGVQALKERISDCISAVSGQSAVGKSSLINALIPNLEQVTQGLSAKIDRGKHTTRVNELFVHHGLKIVDTPGFSSLELDIDYRDLSSYYPEFSEYLGSCRYLDCSHIKEGGDCQIIHALNNNQINKDRYNRYIQLYTKLKENWEKKYD